MMNMMKPVLQRRRTELADGVTNPVRQRVSEIYDIEIEEMYSKSLQVTGRSQGFILLLGCKGVRYDLHGIGKPFRKEPAMNRICRKSGRKG
jgi:hypothetical protein